MGLGYMNFIAGAVLTEAQVDGYLMRQTVMTFASAAARDSALSGVLDEGMYAYTEDNDRTWHYNGSAWFPVGGRVGCEAYELTQSCANGVNTAVNFDTESWDTDAFHSGTSTNVTIPSGLGGIYLVSGRCQASTTLGGSGAAVSILVDGAAIAAGYVPAGFTQGSVTNVVELSVGRVLTLAIFNGHGSTINYSGTLSVTLLSP